MSFQTSERIFALAAEAVPAVFTQLHGQFAEPLPDGPSEVLTIGAHWDDEAHTRMRAASLDAGTIRPMPLSDGRVAYRCLWQEDLAAHFDAQGLAGVEELTEEQLEALRVAEI